jgi:hypothetical protein
MTRWSYGTVGGGMLDAYNAHPKSIGDLLSDSLKGTVVVPPFQRGYSWGKKHVQAFWDDITRFQKESAAKAADRYFLGPIVIMQPDDKKETTYILDGQQRLATATILFSVLRDLAGELNTAESHSFADDIQNHLITKEDYGYCLEMGELDKEYFQETVQSTPTNNGKKSKLRSHRAIKKARELLRHAVGTTLSADPAAALKQLQSLRTLVRRDLIMAAIPVRSERDAFRIFETLNDRGLRLSVPDLLLNYLMGSGKDAVERVKIRKYWDGMIQGMGKRDIGAFLRHIWVSKYGDLKSQDLFSALKQHIEKNEVNSLDFAKTCAEECERYLELLRADPEDLESAAPYIDRLINSLGFDNTLPLLLSAHTVLDKKGLEKVTKWLLVFVVRYTIFLALDPSGQETMIYELARDIRSMDSGKILSHIKNTLTRRAPDDKQMKSMKLDGDDYTLIEPADAIYITGQLANHMQSKTKELKLGESNLEHIFPRNPSSDWKNSDELEPYLWHLGNLTMVGKKLNANAGNSGFDEKKQYYAANTELEITQQIVKQYQKWDSAGVQKRAEQLLPLVLEIWNFDNPSRV